MVFFSMIQWLNYKHSQLPEFILGCLGMFHKTNWRHHHYFPMVSPNPVPASSFPPLWRQSPRPRTQRPSAGFGFWGYIFWRISPTKHGILHYFMGIIGYNKLFLWCVGVFFSGKLIDRRTCQLAPQLGGLPVCR